VIEQPELVPQTFSPPLPQPSFVDRYSVSPFVFAFVSLLLIFILYQVVGGLLTLLFVGTKVTSDTVTMQRMFTMGGQFLFLLLPTLILARLLDRKYSHVFPWRMPHVGETIFAVMSLLFLQETLQIYLFFQDRIPLPDQISKFTEPARQMLEEMFRTLVSAQTVPELLFVILVVAVTPAIAEELLFRGLIQSSFERVSKPWRAAIWTGVIFGLFHFNPFSIVPLIALGIFFGFLRMRSKSMVIAMVVHFLNNVLAVFVTFLQMDDKMIIGATKGSDVNIPSILAQMVLFLMLFVVSFSSYLQLTKDVQSSVSAGS
jgi:membrane protease YdiL (CAAX protease family)